MFAVGLATQHEDPRGFLRQRAARISALSPHRHEHHGHQPSRDQRQLVPRGVWFHELHPTVGTRCRPIEGHLPGATPRRGDREPTCGSGGEDRFTRAGRRGEGVIGSSRSHTGRRLRVRCVVRAAGADYPARPLAGHRRRRCLGDRTFAPGDSFSFLTPKHEL